MGHYPIHLCPGSLSAQGPYGALVPRFLTSNPYLTTGISIGVYGQGRTSKEDFVKLNQWLERRVKDLGGVDWVYSSQFRDEERYWQIYDRELYDRIRRKYHASGSPNVWDKVRYNWEAGERTTRKTRLLGTAVSIWAI